MQEPVQLKMTLPKIPDIELVALEGLERLSRHLGIAEEKIGEARIIVTEAIINAFEHGGDKNPGCAGRIHPDAQRRSSSSSAISERV